MANYDLGCVKQDRLSRDELFDLVWSQRLSEVCKKYYVSESGLIKICQELKIPLPTLKYWITKNDNSSPPEKPILPSYSGYSCTYLKLREDMEKTKEAIQNKLSMFTEEIKSDPNVKLKVPEKLTNPDPLITNTRDKLLKKEVYSRNQGIVSSHQGSLGIYVSPNHIGRALRFMDTMVKAFKSRGHEIVIKDGTAHIVLFGEEYWISCQEKEKRVTVKNSYGSTNTELEPTGRLAFRLGESYYLKEWVEGITPIEDQVLKILANVEFYGWKKYQERIEREKQRAIEKERERIAKELQDRKDKELKDFKEIFKLSKRHEQSEVIRRYADELEKWAMSRNELTDELKEKIEWIRKKADWYDPFVEADDELLMDVDRDELAFKRQSNYW
jgi:hypothetical protein